jgi:hypothetical protein
MARQLSAEIALVKLIPVQHTSWLGTEWGYMNFTLQAQVEFDDYQATVEDYGIEFTPVLFEGIAQVADYVDAQTVFAQLPASRIPLWTRFQRWTLGRHLARQKRQWIQHPVYDSDASGTIPEAAAELFSN